ncbi:hypothetical protein CDL12_05751 [Handroanthus impetiginosus]|uniref:C2 NT-type domain-containing protein n=1 Tax=Handroanthus impetiginosus TaxID=429701 RepID=A0A2G9HVJ6_9LAMI|nr:hypothetical protein CDL12_05751 [Handroanthus impetiginosus]
MSSRVESTMGDNEDFCSGYLLRDIEEISKALYLHKNLPKALSSSSDHHSDMATKTGKISKSKAIIQGSSHKDKKSSIWNWKPLKALTHIRNHRFNCCFFLNVHAIEGLPPNFNKLNLCVSWKWKGDVLQTHPAPVSVGVAEFEETLMHQCTVYASRTGHQNIAKYEPKIFSLHASVIEAPALDIGKHWIDLTRLLPLTLEELQGENRRSGKWTTSFRLTGEAAGAMLNASFGYSVLDSNSFEPGYFVKVPDFVGEGGLITSNHLADFDNSRISQPNKFGGFPTVSTQESQNQSSQLKFLNEIVPDRALELEQSIKLLYEKLDEGKVGNATDFDLLHESQKLKSGLLHDSAPRDSRHEHFRDTESTVTEQSVELSMMDQVGIEQQDSHQQGSQRFDSFAESVEWNSKLDINDHVQREGATDDAGFECNDRSVKEPTIEELDSVWYDTFTSRMQLDSLSDIKMFYEQENCSKTKVSYNKDKLSRLFSLDDIAESIENDFLNMLSIAQSPATIDCDSSPESPRDHLLREFEEDAMAWENLFLDTDLMAVQEESCSLAPLGYAILENADDLDLSFSIQEVERNNGSLMQSMRTSRNVKMLENLETESLMHEWGMDETTFQNSSQVSSSGFGSPIYVPAEEPLKLPSLGEGLGPIIRTRNGSFLRSMNPLVFRNAKNGARLTVQFSAPVVLPMAMGFTNMEILQFWASEGAEKMSTQAKKLMPLEDITGQTIQQVVSEAESSDSLYSCSTPEDMESEYASCENLVPMAITDIEGFLVDGLKIQSGMQDNEAPSRIKIHFSYNSASMGKTKVRESYGSEKASCLQILDVDELVKYSVSLEEWMRLDSGDFDSKANENVLKVLAAHCAKSIDLSSGQLIREDERVELLGRTCGVFGDNLWMALTVQLRDPLRNYEMVGSSMLALIHVKRVCSPEKSCNSNDADMDEKLVKEEIDFKRKQDLEKGIPRFKVLEAHLAGPNVSLANKQLWGTIRQHQSGSRWLLSSGMVTTKKHPISNSNAIIKPSSTIMRETLPGDVLWSISAHPQGESATWDEVVALNVHIRNPDIIFPNESSAHPHK